MRRQRALIDWQVLDQGSRPGITWRRQVRAWLCTPSPKVCATGILTKAGTPIAARGFAGLLKHLVTVDTTEDLVNLHSICSTAGLGGVRTVAARFEYYVGEPIITNDLHGIGPDFVMPLWN